MKKFIQSLELRLSDLFLFIGFIAFAIFLIFGQEFMQQQDPTVVALPLWAAIIAFVVMVGCWGYYLYLELFVRKEYFNPYIAISFIALMMLNIIAIFVQPKESFVPNVVRFSSVDESLVGTTEIAHLVVTPTHKFVFIGELIGVASFIYIGLFVFSKRIKNIKFIEYLGYALFGFLFVLIIYSYITEYNQYIGFIKYVLGIDRIKDLTNELTVKSFIIHRNAFGMCCMLGIIFCLINQSIKPRKWYYPLAAYFFISMIFSYCKTGILLSVAILFIYFIYRLIVTFKEHKKRNTITLIAVGSVILIAFVVIGLPYLTKGKIFGKIYELIKEMTGEGQSIKTRSYIWDNCWLLLKDGWWLIGRGFGAVNLQLWPLNKVSHEEIVFPTHSAFMNMLAEGGIFLFLAYLAFLAYVVYVIIKSYKKSPELVVTVSLGVICFFLYSFIETIQYLMYVFLFPIFVIYFQKENNEVKN